MRLKTPRIKRVDFTAIYAPDRQRMLKMIDDMGWSDLMATQMIGCTQPNLSNWRRGKSTPCRAAIRVVWLLWNLKFNPSVITTAGILTWGHDKEAK